MAVQQFRKMDFEAALTASLQGTDLSWKCVGLVGAEYHYQISISTYVRIDVNSSVAPDHLSRDTGEDSIRAWISSTDGTPLGNKIQKWITRQRGWESRLSTMLGKLLEMAEAIHWCDKCASHEKVFIVKKDGKNKGRLFVKCNCPNSFEWLDEVEQEEPVAPVPADYHDPKCPKCGGMMVRRNGKFGEFWGCRIYPACNGTLNISSVVNDIEWKNKFAAKEAQQELEAEKSKADFKKSVEFPALTKNQLMELAIKQVKEQREAVESKPKAFCPSEYQEAVFTWVNDNIGTGNNLVVEAVAGSGKTTTGVEMLKRITFDKSVLFVAFGKQIADTLRERITQPNIKVSTCHSLGYAILRKVYGNVSLDEDKVYHILDAILDRNVYKSAFPLINSIASLLKANLLSGTAEDIDYISNYYGIEMNGDRDIVCRAIPMLLDRAKSMTGVVDFDDMVWLPVVLNLTGVKYDVVFADEAQDLNKAQIELILACVKPGGNIICVGDRFQSIYGFRGADIMAIPNIINRLDSTTLPLSISYRNPVSIVELVNAKFPEIGVKAASWASLGTIKSMTSNEAEAVYAPGDMVLCRTNAPLVAPAFSLIRRGVKAIIRGRDIGKGLLTLIRKMRADSIFELIDKLTVYADREVSKLEAADKTQAAQALKDKVDTIIALSDECESIIDIEDKISTVFSEDSEGVVFSSVHRAKGLEAKTVYILHPELLPHPSAKKEWELVQERNLEYVAITRTLDTLVYVTE